VEIITVRDKVVGIFVWGEFTEKELESEENGVVLLIKKLNLILLSF